MYPYLINGDNVVVVVDNEQYTANRNSHANFDQILEAIKNNNWIGIEHLFNVKKAVVDFSEGQVQIVNGVLMFDGAPLNSTIATRMLDMFKQGFNIRPMALFLQNLMKNPSRTAIQELYLFLETGNMPITDDGHFLAYKKVRNDFKDIYTGTMDNSPGQVVSMLRNEVDDDRNNTCSAGLHFCSLSYLGHYGGSTGNRVVIVKINPADVVSIPSDYQNTKGRTWKYHVVGEYTGTYMVDAFSSPVYSYDDVSTQFNEGGDVHAWSDQIYDLEEQNNDLNAQIEDLENVIDGDVSSGLVDAINKEIMDLEIKINNNNNLINDLEEKIDEVEGIKLYPPDGVSGWDDSDITLVNLNEEDPIQAALALITSPTLRALVEKQLRGM